MSTTIREIREGSFEETEIQETSNEKLLIVGGTGFIGRRLTKKAANLGFQTFVLSLNKPSNEEKIIGVKYIQADITNLALIKERLPSTNFDYVVNLAGYIDHSLYSDGGRSLIYSHFDGLQNLLQALDWRRLKRFVQIGSSDEYGNQPAPQNEKTSPEPISPYSLGKLASTQLLQMIYRTEALPVVILRLFLVYGPGNGDKRFLSQIIKGCFIDEKFSTSAGKQLRDFCYVDDVIDGILLTFKNNKVNGEIINLASGVPVSIRTMVEMVVRLVGKGNPKFGEIKYRTGENMSLFADISKAKKLIDWNPQISLENGIKKTINWMRKNNGW